MSFSRSGLKKIALPAILAAAGCEDVLVSAVPVFSVEVQPAAVTLVVGQSQELGFVALGEGGQTLAGRTAVWTVLDGRIAQVDGNGIVLALAPGETVVRARSEGVTGEATFAVVSRPVIELLPTALQFMGVEGQADPAPDTVRIQNGGAGVLSGLNRAITYGDGGAVGWLRADLTQAAAPAQLIVRPEIDQLVQGVYTATVQVSSSVAVNSPQSVQVSLTIGEQPPRIDLQETEPRMNGTRGATQPSTSSISVTNGGGGQLLGLAVSPVTYRAGEPTGWLQAELAAASAPTTLTLRAYPRGSGLPPGGLLPGVYHAVVTISAPTASNSPATVTVTFTIT